MIIIFL